MRHGRGESADVQRNASAKADKRRSRQRPMSPSSKGRFEMNRSPAQPRPTNGNPSKPERRTPRPPHKDHVTSKNAAESSEGFEKEDPSAMPGIMDKALKITAEQPPRVRQPVRESIVHRPRPIPRRYIRESIVDRPRPIPRKYPVVRSRSRKHWKAQKDTGSQISESTETIASTASASAGASSPSKRHGNATVDSGTQDAPPVVTKNERGLGQVSPMPGVSTSAVPL